MSAPLSLRPGSGRPHSADGLTERQHRCGLQRVEFEQADD